MANVAHDEDARHAALQQEGLVLAKGRKTPRRMDA
jgi:hypothetical protein